MREANKCHGMQVRMCGKHVFMEDCMFQVFTNTSRGLSENEVFLKINRYYAVNKA